MIRQVDCLETSVVTQHSYSCYFILAQTKWLPWTHTFKTGCPKKFLYLSGGSHQAHTEPHTRTLAQLINSYGLHRLEHQAALLSIRWTDIREMPIWSAILYVDSPSAFNFLTASRSITVLRLRFLYTPRSLALAIPSA